MSLRIQPLRGTFDSSGRFSMLSEGIASINFNGSFGKTVVTKKIKDLQVGDVIKNLDSATNQLLPLMIISFVHNVSLPGVPKFYVYYLDQANGNNVAYVTGATTNPSTNDVYFTGEEDIVVEIEDPQIFQSGENGWAISKYGNAIFSNVKLRGEIEATSGEISGLLNVGPSMQIGNDNFFETDPTRYYGMFIDDNNYFLTYQSPVTSYQINKMEVSDVQVSSGLSKIRINVASSEDYVADAPGSTDPKRIVVLYGLQGALSVLNGSAFISAKGTGYVEIIRKGIVNGTYDYSSAAVKPQTGLIDSNKRINISSIVVSNAPEVTVRRAVITAPQNDFEIGMLVEISGVTSNPLLPLNDDYVVVDVSKPTNSNLNTFTIEGVTFAASPYTYYKSHPGTFGTVPAGTNEFGTGSNPLVKNVVFAEDSSKFKVGSQFNSMSYDSQLDKLRVTGEINARGGSFADTVTIGAQAKVSTISKKSIVNDIAIMTTVADHDFVPGDIIVVAGVDSIFNGTYEVLTTPTLRTFTYDKEPSENISESSSSGTVTVGESRDGTLFVGYGSNRISIKGTGTGTTSAIFAGAGNYKNADTGFFMDASGRFSLKDKLFFENDDLTITGKITASTLNVGGNEGIIYNGTGTVYIGSNVNIAANLTVNAIQVGVSPSFLKISNDVSGTNDGLYINSNNYWYSTGSFSIGSETGTVSYDPTDADVELRVTSKLSVGTNSSGNITLFGGGTGASTYIKVGTGNFYTETAKFYVDGAGKFSLGDKLKFTPGVGLEIVGSGTFSGSITAASGNIGGFAIGATSLTAGTGSTSVGLNTTGYPFYAGNAVPSSAPFRVSSTGILTASSANITGAITATSGSFTGDVKVDVGGKLYAGASPTTGQRIVIDSTGLYGFNSGNISVFSLPSNGTPTIANFKILETSITSDGANANIIAGTTGLTATNITIRGDKTGGQAAAIYSTLNGTTTTATSGNGFYVDDAGKFRFASGTNSISGSNGSLNVTGTITGSSIIGNQITGGAIRGSDVFAKSAQLGGSEYGWIAGSGELYSGTLGSTFFLQSGFWSNPVRSMVQGPGTTYSPAGTISTSPRTNVLKGKGTSFNSTLSLGYTINIGSTIIGIVSRVVDNETAILQSPSLQWVEDSSWSYTKYVTTITLHYFNDSSTNDLVSIENASPSGYSFVGGIIRSVTDPYTFTVDCIPKQNISYAKESGFLTTFTGSANDLVFELKNVYSSVVVSSADQEENFYNVYIFPTDASAASIGDLNIGDNIYLENIPSDTNTFYPLNNGYYPIISFVNNSKAVVSKSSATGVLVYADGYLNYLEGQTISTYPTTVERTKSYQPFAVTSVSARGGVVTIKTNAENDLVVGQNVTVYGYVETPYLSDDFQGTHVISSVNTANKTFTYELTFPDLAETSISNTFAKSLPTMKRKNYDKNYALWVGSQDPNTAPLSIDPYGNKLKVKDLEVTGEVTGFYSDIIELDDFSGAFNGKKNSFYPTYNYKRVEVNNPLSMVLSLNGVVQSAFIANREYVWTSHFLAYDGITIDHLGRIKFSQSPPTGSRVNARLFPGPKNNKIVRKYPFKPVDIALG